MKTSRKLLALLLTVVLLAGMATTATAASSMHEVCAHGGHQVTVQCAPEQGDVTVTKSTRTETRGWWIFSRTVKFTDFTMTAVAKTGYTYAGWYEGATNLNKTATFTISSLCEGRPSELTDAFHHTYTARFTANDVTLTIVDAGATPSTQTQTKKYDEVMALPADGAGLAGHTFDHWEKSGAYESVGADIKMKGNVTLTAVYVENAPSEYTVTLNKSGNGTGEVTGAGSYLDGTNATVSAIAAPDSFFTGWFEGSEKISEWSPYSFGVAGNRTLVANFDRKPVQSLVPAFVLNESVPGVKNVWTITNPNEFGVSVTYRMNDETEPACEGEVIPANTTVTREFTPHTYRDTLNVNWESAPGVNVRFGVSAQEFYTLTITAYGDGDVVKQGTTDSLVGGTYVWNLEGQKSFTLVPQADAGTMFIGWGNAATGLANPLLLTLAGPYTYLDAYFVPVADVTVSKTVVVGSKVTTGAGFGFEIDVDEMSYAQAVSPQSSGAPSPYVDFPKTGSTNDNGEWTVQLPDGNYVLTETDTRYPNNLNGGFRFAVYEGEVHGITLTEDDETDLVKGNTIFVENYKQPDPEPNPNPNPGPAPAPAALVNLDVSVVGQGTVAPGSNSYSQNSTVVFTVTPAAGYEFLGWTGTDGAAVADNRIVMTGNRSVIANFGLIEEAIAQEETPATAPEVSPVAVPDETPVVEETSVEEVVTEEEVPLDTPELPKTGGFPMGLAIALGAAFSGTGLAMKRRKSKDQGNK